MGIWTPPSWKRSKTRGPTLADPTPLNDDAAQPFGLGADWRPKHAALPRRWKDAERYPVPTQWDFINADTGRGFETMAAPDLEAMAAKLIGEHPRDLDAASSYLDQIDFLWKSSGGRSRGRDVLGKTTKLSGLTMHYTDKRVVIWLAADHLQNEGPSATYRRIRYILAHELSHVGETDTDDPDLCLIGHEVEDFVWLAKHFGDVMSPAARQLATQLKMEL